MIRTAIFLGFLSVLLSCKNDSKQVEIPRWDIYEVVLTGPSSGNPFLEVELSATFSTDGYQVEVPGFYDGQGTYRIRFSPHLEGEWSYETKSNSEELSGNQGGFLCSPPGQGNFGPVQIVNTFGLEYADGSPYFAVGTTAYQWTSVAQKIQAKTLETLAGAPFNKIRMCVFPKNYRFGNDSEPWEHPFEGDGDNRDYSRPNYKFFQNFDRRIEQLLELGIQADVILFHPYDIWGYSSMGKENDERYVRYMISRISAYRNVWWSMANEWDIPSIKETIDWEGLGTLIMEEDPHQRLRGIHNWYNTEDHFYDHNRPWITHASIQTSQFFNAIRWREQYKKPLLFDEMRYEGDVSAGWGNLSGEEMASYFWMAALSGGYGTHGDTHQNQADDSTEVRWWGKGGLLVGTSPERIAFFRGIMEQVPVTRMIPYFSDNGDPEDLESNIHILSREGEIYLAYVADAGLTIELELPGTVPYSMQILDTWKMVLVEETQVDPGSFIYTPRETYLLIRLEVNQ